LQKVRQEFHHYYDHCGAREKEGQMSGMQGNQRRPAIRVVLREDLPKKLSPFNRLLPEFRVPTIASINQ
jgi:hypothetical protein